MGEVEGLGMGAIGTLRAGLLGGGAGAIATGRFDSVDDFALNMPPWRRGLFIDSFIIARREEGCVRTSDGERREGGGEMEEGKG